MVLDDFDIGKLETHIKRTNFELVGNLTDNFKEGAIGWELFLEDLQRVITQAAVVVDSQPY